MSFPRTLSWMGAVIALVPAVACSSSTSTKSPNPNPTPTSTSTGVPPPPMPTGHDLNPYGIAYPTANIGYSARKGSVPGNVIKNYKFLGYANANPSVNTDVSPGLQTVAFADYFDPQNKTFKLLHVGVAAVWCNPCNLETNALAGQLTQSLLAKGVVFIQALDDGPVQGVGATNNDLTGWVKGSAREQPASPLNFTAMLDPGNENLGQFFDAAAIPWNAYIDVRTMEILNAGVGYSGDPAADAQPWLTWVENNKPSY